MKSVPVKNVSYWLVYVTVLAAVLAVVRNLAGGSQVVFLTPMGTLAGVCFLLLAGVYFRILKRGLRADLMGVFLLMAVAAIGVYRLIFLPVFISSDFSFALDELGYRDLSVSAATAFLLVVASIVLCEKEKYRASQWMLFASICVSYFYFLGYLYAVPEFYVAIRYIPMAFETSLVFWFISFAFLILQEGRGYLVEFDFSLSGGRAARVLFPVAFLVPTVVGFLRMFGEWYSLFSTSFGVSIIVSVLTIFFSITSYLAVKLVNKRDRLRKLAEADARRAHADLVLLNEQLNETVKELHLLNKEYQAQAEELSTANEELQASTEELITLNDQLELANEKIKEQSAELLKQKEGQLNLSEANLHALLDSTDHSFTLLGVDYSIKAFNAANASAVLKNTGHTVAVGDNVLDLVGPRDKEQFLAVLERVRTAGQRVSYERTFVNQGVVQSLMITVSPVRTISEEFVGYCVTAVDQTELRTSERKLAEERRLLRTLIDHLPLNVYVKDLQSRKIIANRAEYEFMGFKNEGDLIGKSDAELYPNHSAAISLQEDRDVFTSGKPIVNRETLNTKKDGTQTCFLISKIPLRNDENEIIGLVGISFNITDRKRNEEELRSVNERFELLSRATNDAIWDWNILTEQEIWNHGLRDLFEIDAQSTDVGKPIWLGGIHPDDRAEIEATIKRAFETKAQTWERSYRFKHANGNYRYVLNRAYVIFDQTKKAIRMIGAMQDITELMEYRRGLEDSVAAKTQQLKLALESEKEAAEIKSRFISMVSHEFRTPLSTISIAGGMLRKYRDRLTPEEWATKLDTIQRQVSQMTRLLDDVLVIGRAESQRVNVTRGIIQLRPFIDHLAEEISQSHELSHTIEVHCENLPAEIDTDEKLLRQILSNLLTNAIKFSPGAGRVDLRVMRNDRNLVIRVRDFGIGIPENDQKDLFETFHRASNATTIQGTGLGLAIVKNAVDLLRGTISFTSIVNKGTEFVVALPL